MFLNTYFSNSNISNAAFFVCNSLEISGNDTSKYPSKYETADFLLSSTSFKISDNKFYEKW